MTSAEIDRCRTQLALVSDDATHDAMALDGQQFTGRVVATQFGNTLAMISALCGVLGLLLDELAQP